MSKEFKVVFQPSGRRVFVLPGTTILEAAAQAGFILEAPCGGAGKCGKCVVRVTSGECPCTGHESEHLDASRIEQGYRLACHCKVNANLDIEVPETSLYEAGRKASMQDEGVSVGAPVEAQGLGIAFDIGTTTIVGTLTDLATGRELAVSGVINPQTAYGDDVISRIKKCRDEKDGLATLQSAVMKTVNTTIAKLLRDGGAQKKDVGRIAFAGNTAMQQILCGIDPSGLGEIPFKPAFIEPPDLTVSQLGVALDEGCSVYVFPQIGGFVGGDTVSGILATRIDLENDPMLLVDVGTNGEIVLAKGGEMIAASVAAGPAFEGARIVNGMRAAQGAIEKVVFEDGDLEFNIIGNSKAVGLCGTGVIDAVATLLSLGVIDMTGRVQSPEELPSTVPDAVKRRLVRRDGYHDVLLVDAGEAASRKPLYLYQRDVRELQLANAAIRAGINILLDISGLKADDLGAILMAGAFGNFIRRNNAVRIGMLPALPHEKIRFVGNAASLGAKRVVRNESERATALMLARSTRHIDLSLNPDFQEQFSVAMMFPE